MSRLDVTSPVLTQQQSHVRRDTLIQGLLQATPEQVDTWVDNNVQSIQDARDVLKMVIKALVVIGRKQISG